MKTIAFFLTLPLLLLAAPLIAAEEVQETHVMLHPAEVRRPAMQIQLLPPLMEQNPGNAAPLYMKAFVLLAQDEGDDVADEAAGWLAMPPEELPRDEVRGAIEEVDAALRYVDMAARRSRCEWELPIREEENIFELMLPELSAARSLATMVALRTRLHIAEGDYPEAIRSLQTGYAMARHVARQPVLVSGLVGIHIAEQMTDQVETLVQAPGVPNLYWTVTALPDPLINLRRAIQLEANTVYLIFPEFEEAMREDVPEEHWANVLREVIAMTRLWQSSMHENGDDEDDELDEDDEESKVESLHRELEALERRSEEHRDRGEDEEAEKLERKAEVIVEQIRAIEEEDSDIDGFIDKAYPVARRAVADRWKHQQRERRELREHIERLEGELEKLEDEGEGEAAEGLRRHIEELDRHAEPMRSVDEMSRAEVVVRHVFATYEELRDDMFKWFHVPYWQARPAIEAAERRVREVGGEQEVVPLASVILPAIGACHLRAAESQRRIAALRCIEAIRLFAAGHEGALPDSLDEVERVPVPINPVTGKPFSYRREGNAAVLTAEGPARSQRTYRLELRK